MIVYLATNQIDGKQYVGQTKNTLEYRCYHHRQAACRVEDKTNSKFYNAIRKHGWENFDWSILYEGARIDKMEKFFIKKLNTMEEGYNMTPGGIGGYCPGRTNGRAKKYLIRRPDGIMFQIHGTLKAFCDKHDLAFAKMFHWVNKGEIQPRNSRSFHTPQAENCVGWEIKNCI